MTAKYDKVPSAAINGTKRDVLVEQIAPNPWNYNVQSPEMFGKMVESLRRFGFVQPIIVRAKGEGFEIINGEHRWRAAREAHMGTIPVIDLGALSDADAKQLSIVLNELGGNPDQVRLADLLRDIRVDVPIEELQAVMPFTANELSMYLEAVDFSFDNLSGEDTRPKDAAAPVEEGFESEDVDQGSASEAVPMRRLVFRLARAEADVLEKQLQSIHENPVTALRTCVQSYIAVTEQAKPQPPVRSKKTSRSSRG